MRLKLLREHLKFRRFLCHVIAESKKNMDGRRKVGVNVIYFAMQFATMQDKIIEKGHVLYLQKIKIKIRIKNEKRK